jgi:3'-5' exoribonuclease
MIETIVISRESGGMNLFEGVGVEPQNGRCAVMGKGKFIKELQAGQEFGSSVFVVRDASIREDKNGNCYIAATLADRSGQANAKLWSATPAQCAEVRPGRFVMVSGKIQSGQYAGDIDIRKLQALDPPADLDDFLPPLPTWHAASQEAFQATVASLQQPYLRALAQRVFDPNGATWAQFVRAVAAKNFHHSYGGGLLDHTLEVARLCDATCTVMPGLRRDFLIACALFHDIGKLDEMDHGLAAGEYSAAGNLIGHIILGMQRVVAVMDEIPDFPPALKHGVMHMILSHHGKLEFGSPKTPMCAEAEVLSCNDKLSARLDQSREALANAPVTQHSVRIRGWDSVTIHNGDFDLNGHDLL